MKLNNSLNFEHLMILLTELSKELSVVSHMNKSSQNQKHMDLVFLR